MTAATSVTATFAFTTFTDNPLAAGTTIVKAVHFTELRTEIDALRTTVGVKVMFSWTDPELTPGITMVRVVHLIELRAALDEAYRAANQPPPSYTDPDVGAGFTVIQAIHLNELRAGVLRLKSLRGLQ